MKTVNDLGKPLTGRAVIYKKETVEDCRRISIFEMRKSGTFKGFKERHGKPYLDIDYKGIHDRIGLASTACYFNGVRWWLICPGCGGRRGILYKPYYAQYFRCRHCHNLTYWSTQMRRCHLESFIQWTVIERKYLRLLEGVGQKGFSKREALQQEKIERRMLEIAYALRVSNDNIRKRWL